jgi:hypothetical protein
VAVGRTKLRHDLALFVDLEARQLQVLDHLPGDLLAGVVCDMRRRAGMHALPRPGF